MMTNIRVDFLQDLLQVYIRIEMPLFSPLSLFFVFTQANIFTFDFFFFLPAACVP